MGYLNHRSKQEVLKKMRSWCDYRLRSHYDVRKKLYALGLWKKDVEELLAQLIEEEHVNEGRFATAYAEERFKIEKWGKQKIRQHLKQRRVSDYCVKEATKDINESTYLVNLHRLAVQKWEGLKGNSLFIRMRKTRDYLLQKGYESNLVWDILGKLKKGEEL